VIRTAIAVLACVGLLLLTGCAQKTLHPLRIGLVETQNLLLLITHGKGYFQNEGIRSELVYFESGTQAILAMGRGEIDCCVVGLTPLALAGLERRDLRILASVTRLTDAYRIVGNRNAGILRPDDLRGRRLCTVRRSAMHYYFHNFLTEQNISEREIDWTFCATPQACVDSLLSGAVDAVCIREMLPKTIQQAPAGRFSVFAEYELPVNTLTLVAGDAMLQKKRHQAVALMKALLRGDRFAHEHPREMAGILHKTVGDPGVSTNGVVSQLTLDQGLLTELEDVARWAIQYRLTNSEKLPDYLDLVDMSVLESIAPEAVTIVH
jgi:NitT/TauT family transport system substrate-binding protein